MQTLSDIPNRLNKYTFEKSKDAIKAIQAGEEAARAALPELKRKLAAAGVELKAAGV